VHRARGEFDLARSLVAEALALRERVLPARHPAIAEALYELGWLSGGPPQEMLYRRALSILPDTGATAEQRVLLLQALSTSLRRQGKLPDAVATDREALRVAESAFGPEHHATGAAMIHLADHVRDLEGDLVEAERLYRRGLALQTRRYGAGSLRLLHGLNSLGSLLSARGDAEAETMFRRALDIRRSASGPDHPSIAEGLQHLAGELARQGRLRAAEALQREALAHSIRTLGPQHPVIANLRLPGLADILERRGRHAGADSAFTAALGQTATALVIQGEVRRSYGRLLTRRGAYERAERELLGALDLMERHYLGQVHPNVDESKRALMALYDAWGKPALVERYRVPPGRYVAY
jgi:tetratricopeptide (TPR) repeat protein